LPIAGPPIANGAVVVDGATISWVGASRDAQAATHEQLGNAILLPGLVNAHTHLELTGLRGLLEGLDFREWLRVLTTVRAKVLDERALADASRFGVSEALRAGITTLADCSASGAPLNSMIEAGVRGRVYLETFGPDRAQVADSMTALRSGVERLRAHETSLVRVGVSPHAPYTVHEALFAAVAEYARAEQLPVATHVAESADEVRFVQHGDGQFAERLRARNIAVAGTGASPIALLARTGLLDTQPLCIHAIHTNSDDLGVIADRGATVVHCPISNAKLGQGIAPVRDMLNADIAVGLGTDSVASNDRMDLIAEARQAVLLQSLAASMPDALSSEQVVRMATLGGAHALGLQALGALVPGNAADLCAFSIEAFEAAPVYDPYVLLVHVLGSGANAELTMVNGRVLVRHGQELGFDQSVRMRVQADAERVAAFVTPA
jgi:5-methylthioadenosine/S-adenosylhomocysteine deaminase